MSKPDIKDVLEIVRLKEEAAARYEAIGQMIAKFAAEFAPGRFDYDLEEFLDEYNPDNGHPYDEALVANGRYLKLEITDNIKALQDGGTVWKSTAFEPLSFKTQFLKRCPDSLK